MGQKWRTWGNRIPSPPSSRPEPRQSPTASKTPERIQGPFGGFSGEIKLDLFDKETGQKSSSFYADDSIHLGDPSDLSAQPYRFTGVEIRTRKPGSAEEAAVLTAQQAEGTINFGGAGEVSLTEAGRLSLQQAEVDVRGGHPLAPFDLTASKMLVMLERERFESLGEDAVILEGIGFSAKGWELVLDQQLGLVEFLGGGEFQFTLKNGDVATFVTERGAPLRLKRGSLEDLQEFRVEVEGKGTLSMSGSEEWTLESTNLILEALRRGTDPIELRRVHTSGMVRALRSGNVFTGQGAELNRLPDSDGFDLTIQSNPAADLMFEDEAGESKTVMLRGQGPLIVHGESGDATTEQGEVEFQGQGSILFPGQNTPESSFEETQVQFSQGLDVWMDRTHGAGTFRATGDVGLTQGQAYLRTEVLDSIIWSAEGQAIDITCEGQTEARLIDQSGEQLEFTAIEGAMVKVQGADWIVPQATGMRMSQVGSVPLEGKADELRDLDWNARTFRAWGNVSFQNALGKVVCERITSNGEDLIEVQGTPEAPARLDLLGGSTFSKDVLSGYLSAQNLELRPMRVDAIGSVQSEIVMRQGRFEQSAQELRLTLEEQPNQTLGYSIHASINALVTWTVEEQEQLFLSCESFQLEGSATDALLSGGDLPVEPEANLYKIVALSLEEMRWREDGLSMNLSAGGMSTEGTVWVGRDKSWVEPGPLRAEGGVDASVTGVMQARMSGETLVLGNNPRTFDLTPHEGDNIVITGKMPLVDMSYRMQCKGFSLNEARMEAIEPEFRASMALLPSDTSRVGIPSESLVRAGKLVVTGQGLRFSDGVFASGTDMDGIPLTVRAEDLIMKGDLKRSLDQGADLASMERVELEGGFEVVYGGLARARGREMVILPTYMLLKGDKQMFVRVELAGLQVETERLEFDLENFLVDTTRGVMRGGVGGETWSLEYASLKPVQRENETMFAIASPSFSEGRSVASGQWAMLWIHPEAWRQKGRAALFGEAPPEAVDWTPSDVAAEEDRPDAIQSLLTSLSKEELPHYVRALLMEGNVEAAVGGRRLARADSLYVDVDGTKAWLKNAEISRILRMGGKDHKLRIKTEELQAHSDGSLRADSATLTTCDHDDPHYVIETKDLALIPRPDQRWRFSAEHNRVAFQSGLGLPMPSIKNVVLDQKGGFEGFENERGEVTTVENIFLQNTPRFGTSLGTNLAYDIGKVGGVVAKIMQFDSNLVRGKWKVDGSWLSSRGPLVGLGLQLREPGRERAKVEEFWLDLYVRGIPDDGKDRGILRVPENETDSLRYWATARGRYPFDDREWIDVVFNHQNDAGVQAEFYENEFQRFEERDSYVHWRKARGGHYFNARYQWRQDDFRTQVEELPSLGAYRGLQELFRVGKVPLNYMASVDIEQLRRREGDVRFEASFADGLGDRTSLRGDTTHRLEMPMGFGIPGSRLTPFAEARFTAWDEGADPDLSPSRLVSRAGVRWQGLFTQANLDSYHTLIPRASYAGNVALEEDNGNPVTFDGVEAAQDGGFSEFGLRSLWQRPDIGRWLDFDVAVQSRTNRDNSLADDNQLRFLGGFRTEVGDVPVGVEQDLRQDLEDESTLYSRSIFAVRPTDNLLLEFGHQRGYETGTGPLFEAASLGFNYRINNKWDVSGSNYTNLREGGNLQSSFTLRRHSHDFVLELEVSRVAGEGGTGFGINLIPLLAWKRPRLGILDRK